MNRDIEYVLGYITHYIKDTTLHDSEPMLNWKDLEKLLYYINELNNECNKQKEVLYKIKECIKELNYEEYYETK